MENEEKRRSLIAFHLSEAITPSISRAILKLYPDKQAFFSATSGEQERLFNKEKLKRPFEGRDTLYKKIDALIEKCKKMEITILTEMDRHYPLRLGYIYDRPPILYVKGDLESTALSWSSARRRHCAIVGTRQADPLALHATLQLSAELSQKDIVVISGLAIGIDGAAHEGAIGKDRAQTIAVLGSGLDTIYPRSHEFLGRAILEKGGLLISEYPPGVHPFKYHFPRRNRIIAGLSDVAVLMQSGKKSGANITMEYALDQNKDIYVYAPYHQREGYEGNKKYLAQGAGVLHSIEDLAASLEGIPAKVRTEAEVLEALKGGPMSLCELAKKLLLSEQMAVQKIMLHLIKGEVVSLPGNHYALALER